VHTRKLSKVTMLMTTFLLAIPFAPAAFAFHGTALSIALDNPNQLPGGALTATVSLASSSPINNLQAYHLPVPCSPDVVTASSAGTPYGGFPSIFQSGGSATVAQFGILVSSSSPIPLLTINFMVKNPPGSSINELPSSINVFDADLAYDGYPFPDPTTCVVGGISVPRYACADYSPPASWFTSAPVDIRSFFCHASPSSLNTNSHHGFTVALECSVINNSTTTTVLAGAHWSWVSLGGITGQGGSGPVSLAPGQTGVLTTSFVVPPKVDLYTITAIVGYGFPDGTATNSIYPFTYQVQVVTPNNGK